MECRCKDVCISIELEGWDCHLRLREELDNCLSGQHR